MNRRDFVRSSVGVTALIAVAPSMALARLTPARERDDSAEIQALIDNTPASGFILLKGQTLTLRRPLILHNRADLKMVGCMVTVTGQSPFRFADPSGSVVVTDSIFDFKPSLLTRVAEKFGRPTGMFTA